MGSQCIVVGIDIKKLNNEYHAFSNLGSNKINHSLKDYIKKAEDLGAGEFFINNIDRDEKMNGYDYYAKKYLKLQIFLSSALVVLEILNTCMNYSLKQIVQQQLVQVYFILVTIIQ